MPFEERWSSFLDRVRTDEVVALVIGAWWQEWDEHGIGPALLAIVSSAVIAYVWFLAPLSTLAFDPVALRHLAFFRLGVFAAAGHLDIWTILIAVSLAAIVGERLR